MTARSVVAAWVASAAWLASAAAQQAPVSDTVAATGTVRISLGVEPQSVTVGEPFRAAVRIDAPPGVRASFGPLESDDSLQALGPPTRPPAEGSESVGIYRLVAWVAEAELEATVPVRLEDPAGRSRVQLVRLQLPRVGSVLPAGDEPVEPRPAKGVFDPPPAREGLPWWWWALIVAGALAAGAAGLAALRRRPDAEGDEEPLVPPREWALRHLGELEGRLAVADAGELEALHRKAAWVVRCYLERVEPELGMDLTTPEVTEALGRRGEPGHAVAELRRILGVADRVKFARYRAGGAEARAELAAMMRWVSDYPSIAADAEPPRAA